MRVYRYYVPTPPMHLRIPLDGLLEILGYDNEQMVAGISACGWAEYDRELTEAEIEEWGLGASPENPLEYLI